MRSSAKALFGGGKNKEETTKERVKRYLGLAGSLSEKIEAGKKVYSLFEPHTEWLYKGKANKKVELGHNILVASDQWGFIVEHQVIESHAEQTEESGRTFKKLRHKHSAVESDINRLEHHGLDRCLDKGLHAFKRYCALGVVAANLHKLGNVLQEKARKKHDKLRKAA